MTNSLSHSLPAPNEIQTLVGSEGFERLIAAFYRRVAEDEILRPLYPPGDLAPAARRLRLFLEQYFGGPPIYTQERGHPRLRARHLRFRIDQAARDRWVALMKAALDEVGFAPGIATVMCDYFEMAATFLMNTPSAAGGMFTTTYPSSDLQDET
jgi:hemoglobin